MRGYPILHLLALLIVLLVAGCSSSKMPKISTPTVDAPDKWWKTNNSTSKNRGATPQHKRTSDSDIRSSVSLPQKADIVESRIISKRDAWSEYCKNAGVSASTGNDSGQNLEPALGLDPAAAGVKQEDVDNVRRKYSSELFNAQLRISLIESRMSGTDEDRKSLLQEKLDAARVELAAVEAACRAEIEGKGHIPLGGRPFAMENTVPLTQ